MWKYIRLMRIQDQYVEVSSVLAAGILLQERSTVILWWALATVLLSIPAYIVNELVDRQDSDVYSWNSIHIKKNDRFDGRIIFVLCFLFAVLGLLISVRIGTIFWAVAYLVLGMLYSIEPIRFKRRIGLDLLSQPFIWWSIPFLAITQGNLANAYLYTFLIVTTLIITSVVFPYQIADYYADKKAGHRSTHVMLGVYRSLILGSVIGVVGALLFLVYGMHNWAPWMLPFVIMMCAVLILYNRWFRIRSPEKIIKDMQYWVVRIKPLTQLIFLYFFALWVNL